MKLRYSVSNIIFPTFLPVLCLLPFSDRFLAAGTRNKRTSCVITGQNTPMGGGVRWICQVPQSGEPSAPEARSHPSFECYNRFGEKDFKYAIPSIVRGCILSFLSKIGNRKRSHRAVFEIEVAKAKLRLFFASHVVVMGNLLSHENDYTVLTNDWAVFFIPWLWQQLRKSGNNDPSKSTSWKVLETVLNHL